MAAFEAQNRSLSELNRALESELANREAHQSKLEDQLLEAEKEVGRLEQLTSVAQDRIDSFRQERDQIQLEVADMARTGGRMTAESKVRLEDLARRFPNVQIDLATGICRVESEILFEEGQSGLAPASQSKLDDLAALLQSPEAQDFRIMVVGHTDESQVARRPTRQSYPNNWHLSSSRALAVADYLLQAGVEETRLGVAGYASHEPVASNGTAEDRRRNRRVEVFLLSPNTPIVGWIESIPTLY
jgi:chemotaxis protein MotB